MPITQVVRDIMPEFYFQIKAFKPDVSGQILWPPIESGKISAKNAKDARNQLSEEHGSKLAGRRPKETDGATYPFFVTLTEMTEETPHLHDLFKLQTCLHETCDAQFRVIDKYNDHACSDKGKDFCSRSCRELHRNANRSLVSHNHIGGIGAKEAVIYRITHKQSGKCYIGKTAQIVTLRWYQHLYQPSDNKFHQALKSSNLVDWSFEVIEKIPFTNVVKQGDDSFLAHDRLKDTERAWTRLVAEREQHWISHYDSISNGFNSVSAITDIDTLDESAESQ
jgi:hypothetical protein